MNSRRRLCRWQILTLVGVVGMCGGAVRFATLTKSGRGPEARTGEVVADLQCARALFHTDSRRVVKVGILICGNAETATVPLIPLLEHHPRIEWQRVTALSVRNGILRDLNVLLVPGGSGRLKAEDLGDDGRDIIRDFVRGGGGYVGICGGAFLATGGYTWSLGIINATTLTGTIECGQKRKHSLASRGSGVTSVEFSGLAKGIFSQMLSLESMQYSSGPVFRRGIRSDLPAFVGLASFRTEVYECPSQRGTMVNTPAIIASKYGEGAVLLFSPHPEMAPGTAGLVTDALIAVFGARSTSS